MTTGSHGPLIIPLPTLLLFGQMFLSPWWIAAVCQWGGLQDGGPADLSYILVGVLDDLECPL